MKEKDYYNNLGNWDFDSLNVKSEKLTNWNFYEEIRKNVNERSLCLDLGTGGGEKVLKYYPKVGFLIATDFSKNMIKTAKLNLKKCEQSIGFDQNIRFIQMDNLKMNFPKGLFDLISARHTVIDAKKIYECLKDNGILIIEGIDQKDCWELKEVFGRGQAYKDSTSISEIDYQNIKEAGFRKIERIEIYENEYYESELELIDFLQLVPILDEVSENENENNNWNYSKTIETELLEKYIRKNKTEKGILLKRVLYGIIAKK